MDDVFFLNCFLLKKTYFFLLCITIVDSVGFSVPYAPSRITTSLVLENNKFYLFAFWTNFMSRKLLSQEVNWANWHNLIKIVFGYQDLLTSIELGLTTFDPNTSGLSLDALYAFSLGVLKYERPGSEVHLALKPFFKQMLDLVLSQEMSCDLMKFVHDPIYVLICCYQVKTKASPRYLHWCLNVSWIPQF